MALYIHVTLFTIEVHLDYHSERLASPKSYFLQNVPEIEQSVGNTIVSNKYLIQIIVCTLFAVLI